MPPRFPPRSAECRRNGGFALIIVLWTLVLIGFIVAHLTASGRTEIRIAGNRAAGLDYGRPSAPFETLGDLGRVLGMTPAVMIGIRPHLTLFGPPEPNPATTDPVVAAALALSSTTGSLPARQPIVQAGQASPDNLTVRITALASGPGNARVTRTAVVRTAGTLPQGYAVLAWGTSLNSDAPLGLPPPPVTR